MQNIHVWVGFFVHLSHSSHEIQANTNNWVKWKSCTFFTHFEYSSIWWNSSATRSLIKWFKRLSDFVKTMQWQMCTQFVLTFNFLISVEVWWSSQNLDILPNCTQQQQLNQYGILELIQKTLNFLRSIRTVEWLDQCFRSLIK